MANSATVQEPENWYEAANLFPLLPEEEMNELAADIKANGLLNPVVLLEGKVLDGRNRIVACRMAGVSPTFTEWKGTGSPTSWMISQNVHRRHLTASQKAVLALEAEPLFAAEAKERQRTSTGGRKPHLRSTLTEAGTKGKAADHAARSVGVSSGYVAEVKKIQAKDPSLLPQIKAGTMTIPQAQKKLGFNHRTAPTLVPPPTTGTQEQARNPDENRGTDNHEERRIEAQQHGSKQCGDGRTVRREEMYRVLKSHRDDPVCQSRLTSLC